jgi:hypothetical protein
LRVDEDAAERHERGAANCPTVTEVVGGIAALAVDRPRHDAVAADRADDAVADQAQPPIGLVGDVHVAVGRDVDADRRVDAAPCRWSAVAKIVVRIAARAIDAPGADAGAGKRADDPAGVDLANQVRAHVGDVDVAAGVDRDIARCVERGR